VISEGPVNLLLVQTGEEFGTSERVVWELATRLPSNRYVVDTWLSTSPGLDELASTLEDRGIGVVRPRPIRSAWDLRSRWQTWSALRRRQPSLVHVHAGWADLPSHLPGLGWLAGIEHLVVTAQGPIDRVPEASLALLRQADAVTAPHAAGIEALARAGLARESLRVVPNGADPPDEVAEMPAARAIRERLGAGTFRPLWVSATRLEEDKGHAVLLEALALVAARNLGFVVVLAGEGSARNALERRAAELGLPDAVHFAGAVDSIGPLLLAADAVVVPSLEDTLPTALLQAMARGRAVVASEVGAIPGAITDRVEGRLVPPGNAAALASVLVELHQASDATRQMGLRAAERVQSSFTWKRVVEGYEAVYDEVLGLTGFAPAAPSRPGASRR
jgi:glycosyltransferase involved in cell wall biosynthesis